MQKYFRFRRISPDNAFYISNEFLGHILLAAQSTDFVSYTLIDCWVEFLAGNTSKVSVLDKRSMRRTSGSRSFRVGKIPPDSMVRAVYSHGGKRNPRLVLGPGIGRDTAVVRLAKKLVVLTADPVTGTTKRIGEHYVHINANDIAVTGAKPVWYVLKLLLQLGNSEEELAHIMSGIDQDTRNLQITIA